MSHHSIHRLVWSSTALALAVGIGGCSVGASTKTSTSGTDVTGEEQESYSTNISLHGGGDEAQLEKANALARDRNYAEAMEIYQALYRDLGVDPEVREESLLRLGEAQGAMFNSQKNYGQAIATLEEFLAKYPQSKFAPEAQDSLERFESVEAQLEEGES